MRGKKVLKNRFSPPLCFWSRLLFVDLHRSLSNLAVNIILIKPNTKPTAPRHYRYRIKSGMTLLDPAIHFVHPPLSFPPSRGEKERALFAPLFSKREKERALFVSPAFRGGKRKEEIDSGTAPGMTPGGFEQYLFRRD